MLDLLNLQQDAFGLDISDLSLKIAKIENKKGVLSLVSFGNTLIKPGIIKQGEIKDEDALIEIIKKALSQVKGKKISAKYVVASLPEKKSFLEIIQMPIMKKEQLEKAIYFEAENYIPLPIDQVYLDSQIIPSNNNQKNLDVLIAAFPKKIIDQYISLLKKAGLAPKVLEIESQAIARALIKNETSPDPLLLIDLGITKTSFIIFDGNSIRFTSSIPISSQNFTESISKHLKMGIKQAEELKMKQGLEMPNGKIFEALIPILTDLLEQIKKYIDYYHSHSKDKHSIPNGRKIKKILLCGGGANLQNIDKFLSSELKIPVKLGNPWINIEKKRVGKTQELSYEERNKTSLKYATVLGLALRAAQMN